MVLFLEKKKLLQIYLSNFQTYFHPAAIAPVGEPSQTGVDLFVTKDTANCLFLRKRQQTIIGV
jgi:hypothetical protein